MNREEKSLRHVAMADEFLTGSQQNVALHLSSLMSRNR